MYSNTYYVLQFNSHNISIWTKQHGIPTRTKNRLIISIFYYRQFIINRHTHSTATCYPIIIGSSYLIYNDGWLDWPSNIRLGLELRIILSNGGAPSSINMSRFALAFESVFLVCNRLVSVKRQRVFISEIGLICKWFFSGCRRK